MRGLLIFKCGRLNLEEFAARLDPSRWGFDGRIYLDMPRGPMFLGSACIDINAAADGAELARGVIAGDRRAYSLIYDAVKPIARRAAVGWSLAFETPITTIYVKNQGVRIETDIEARAFPDELAARRAEMST